MIFNEELAAVQILSEKLKENISLKTGEIKANCQNIL